MTFVVAFDPVIVKTPVDLFNVAVPGPFVSKVIGLAPPGSINKLVPTVNDAIPGEIGIGLIVIVAFPDPSVDPITPLICINQKRKRIIINDKSFAICANTAINRTND